MKKTGLVFVFLLALQSVAQAENVTTCRVEDKSISLRKVILIDGPSQSAALALVYANRVESSAADYYDDISFYGYYAETLKAAIEFQDSDEPQTATLLLGNDHDYDSQRVHLVCDR